MLDETALSVAEVKSLKCTVEELIANLLSQFEEDTGAKVVSVSVSHEFATGRFDKVALNISI